MMNQQQPDNFFRKKLQNYQKPAPAGAWDRIEPALEKKTDHKFLWWKIAASILPIAGAAYLLWFHNPEPDRQPMRQTQDEPAQALEEVHADEVERIAEVQTPAIAKETERAATPAKRIRREVKEQIKATVTNETTSAGGYGGIAELPLQEPVSPTVTVAAPPVKSTITLSISAEETNQYLNKNALAEATSNEKKPSTLKKFLKKANDLKSNQDTFGDLRERKNEILALNFKNDKRGQNK